jgi:hypothetical protein
MHVSIMGELVYVLVINLQLLSSFCILGSTVDTLRLGGLDTSRAK